MAKYSIVIPAKDEEERIGGTVEKLKNEFKDEAEIIVVDDGSSDKTSEIAKNLGVKVIKHEANKGKGAAVKTGFMNATGDLIGFVDADESTSAQDARNVFNSIGDHDIAIATRKYPGAKIVVKQPLLRIIAGDMFHLLTELFFHIGIRDTQCGCKVFKKNAAKDIASKMISSGFEFDVEMLYLARRNKYSIKLVPIIWKHEDKSKLSITRHGPKMLQGLMRLKMHYLFR